MHRMAQAVPFVAFRQNVISNVVAPRKAILCSDDRHQFIESACINDMMRSTVSEHEMSVFSDPHHRLTKYHTTHLPIIIYFKGTQIYLLNFATLN